MDGDLLARQRADFIIANAVPMVAERDQKIKRQAAEIQKLLHAKSQLRKEVERLKRGDFTPEEFQNLCHHRDEKPGCTYQEFCDGCAEYQRQLFGKSERNDRSHLDAIERVEMGARIGGIE